MGSFGTASISYELTDKIGTLIVPASPAQPQLVAREDGLNRVTIEVAKASEAEAWHCVQLRNGVLLVFMRDGTERRDHYVVIIKVPLARLGTLKVVTAREVLDAQKSGPEATR